MTAHDSSSAASSDAPHPPGGRGAETLEISNALVRIYKSQFGRGPTSTRTEYAGDNTVICSLHGSMTAAEHNLVKMGEQQQLRGIRLLFQYASETEFRDEVERITQRTVVGFISGMDVEQDVAAEVFYLEPAA